jgi:hypothetical protein
VRTLRSLLLDFGVTSASDVRISWRLATSCGARTRTAPRGPAAAISARVELLVSAEEAFVLHEAGAQLFEDTPDAVLLRSRTRGLSARAA